MSLVEKGKNFTENLSKLIAEIAERRGVSQNQLAKNLGFRNRKFHASSSRNALLVCLRLTL